MSANLDMTLTMDKTPNRAGQTLIKLLHTGLLGLALGSSLASPAQAAGQAPTKTGPGAPIFTQGNPAYQGISNAQTNVSANAPAGAAGNLTGMVNQPPTIIWATPSNTIITAPASFTLTVNASDPDGSVARIDYYNGATLIGSSTSAPFGITWNNVGAGQYTLTAVATDNLGMSTTAAAITVIANQPPSISLDPPTGPLYSPASMTLTANASDSDGSISKVEYYNGSTLIGSSTSSPYSVTWTNVPVGNYSLTAIATDNYGASTTASAVAVNVILTPSSTALNVTSPATVGQATTLTASVTGAAPTGTVTFKDGANTIGSAPINAGSASLNYTFTTAGAHSLTASYAGDANNTTSSSSPSSLTVNPAPTSTTVTATPNPVTAGQGSTITATVSAVNPTGTVTFVDGTTTLGTATLAPGNNSASFSYTFTSAGAHSLTAVYAGDSNNTGSTSAPTSLSVNPASTTVAITAVPSPAAAGQAVSLTATVTSATSLTPTGSITFMEGTTTLGTANLASGSATLSYTFNTAGAHTLDALYSGDSGNAASTAVNTSGPASLSVNPATSTTLLNVTPNPVSLGQSVILTATVSGTNPGGSVTFLDGTNTIGTATLTAGSTSFSYTFTSASTHSLTAVYAGDANNSGSTSTVNNVTVNPVTSTTALTVTPNPAKVGQAVTLTAAVTGLSPTGSVTFMEGSTTLGTANLAAGNATLNYTFSTAGNHSVTASYAGDGSTSGSQSTPVNVTVNSGEAQAYYIHTDQLNTPRQITDAIGNVVWQWDNTDPFGNNMPNENPNGAGQFSFNLRFPGQYYDRETSLNYNVNRDYDAATGRYIESDPIGLEGGINTYAYVEGDPLGFIDSLGLANGPAIGWMRPKKRTQLPDVTAQYGVAGQLGFWIFGATCELGLATPAKADDICGYVQVCGVYGPQIVAALGGQVSVGNGLPSTGITRSQGGTWFGGAGLLGNGQVTMSTEGQLQGTHGTTRGFVGLGGGAGVGYVRCVQATACLRR